MHHSQSSVLVLRILSVAGASTKTPVCTRSAMALQHPWWQTIGHLLPSGMLLPECSPWSATHSGIFSLDPEKSYAHTKAQRKCEGRQCRIDSKIDPYIYLQWTLWNTFSDYESAVDVLFKNKNRQWNVKEMNILSIDFCSSLSRQRSHLMIKYFRSGTILK